LTENSVNRSLDDIQRSVITLRSHGTHLGRRNQTLSVVCRAFSQPSAIVARAVLKREVIEEVVLDPVGYKILLEILAKGTYNSFAEVPYVFGPRKSGRSHFGLSEIWNYLIQIYRLVRQPR